MFKISLPSKFESSNNCLIDSANKFIDAMNYMRETIMLPTRLKDIAEEGKNQDCDKALPSLYGNFVLLNEISKNLHTNSQLHEEGYIEDDNELYAKDASLKFQNQLNNLIDSLNNLSDSAYYLAKKYQENIGEQSDTIIPMRKRHIKFWK